MLTQQSQTDHANIKYSKVASFLVVLSAVLPFLNNIVGYFYNTNVQIDNTVGARSLDLDTSIYYLSISIAPILLAIASLFKPHRYSYYVIIISYYVQLVAYIEFIFFNVNNISIYAYIGVGVALLLIIFVLNRLLRIYQYDESVYNFRKVTLDRYAKLLRKHNDIDQNDTTLR